MKKRLALFLGLMYLLTMIPVYAANTTPSTISMTVVFKSNFILKSVEDTVLKNGGRIVTEIPEVGTIKIEGMSTLLSTLQRNSDVLAVSPTIEFKLPETKAASFSEDETAVNTAAADLYNRYQWDIKQVTDNGDSYALGTGSHNTVVGIIDTGVSTQHSALKANLLGGTNYVPDGPGGTVVSTDIEDKNGHGSHTAGNIAGNGRILGIAPNVGFKSYRVFGATGGSPSDRIINAMIDATKDGVDVISMSIGGFDIIGQAFYVDPQTGVKTRLGNDVADFTAYKRAVKYAVDHGVVVVAAAGNEAINCTNKADVTAYLNFEYGGNGLTYIGAGFEAPGSLPGVITVSATGPDKSLASYSNYGAGFIDIAAPGGDFQRYPAPDYYTDMCLSSYKNGGYVWMAGTSMATPKVAAVAALVIDQAKTNGEKLTPSQITAKLYQTAADLGKPGVDASFGNGMVNVKNGLTSK